MTRLARANFTILMSQLVVMAYAYADRDWVIVGLAGMVGLCSLLAMFGERIPAD